MLKSLFNTKTSSDECRKMQKRVKKLLKDFDKNEIFRSDLNKNQEFVIRKFLYKEIGCLDGIANSLSEEKSKRKN